MRSRWTAMIADCLPENRKRNPVDTIRELKMKVQVQRCLSSGRHRKRVERQAVLLASCAEARLPGAGMRRRMWYNLQGERNG